MAGPRASTPGRRRDYRATELPVAAVANLKSGQPPADHRDSECGRRLELSRRALEPDRTCLAGQLVGAGLGSPFNLKFAAVCRGGPRPGCQTVRCPERGRGRADRAYE
jgi:hypothetical protein